MFAIKLELQRFLAHRQIIAAFLSKSLLVFILINQLGIKHGYWGVVPLLAMSSELLYRHYLQPNVIVLVMRNSHKRWYLLRLMFLMLSVGVNLPLAALIGYFAGGLWLSYWIVLDILGYLFHCIACLSSQLVGSSIRFLLLIPIAYPWVLLGVMSSEYNLMTFKLLWSAWMLMFSVGVFFYLFCFQAGQSS